VYSLPRGEDTKKMPQLQPQVIDEHLDDARFKVSDANDVQDALRVIAEGTISPS
jgi:hypothetical protein